MACASMLAVLSSETLLFLTSQWSLESGTASSSAAPQTPALENSDWMLQPQASLSGVPSPRKQRSERHRGLPACTGWVEGTDTTECICLSYHHCRGRQSRNPLGHRGEGSLLGEARASLPASFSSNNYHAYFYTFQSQGTWEREPETSRPD